MVTDVCPLTLPTASREQIDHHSLAANEAIERKDDLWQTGNIGINEIAWTPFWVKFSVEIVDTPKLNCVKFSWTKFKAWATVASLAC